MRWYANDGDKPISTHPTISTHPNGNRFPQVPAVNKTIPTESPGVIPISNAFRIRTATVADAPALLEIYAPYVRDTAVTFAYQVPTPEDFAHRIHGTLAQYPYLVGEVDGVALGYAYAGPFQTRAAYAWSAETSIYIHMEQKGRGLGGRLYRALERCLRAQGLQNLYACIAWPPEGDPFLTRESVDFHQRMGYRQVGWFHQCGCKFGRWYDMVWMEKSLGHHAPEPTPPQPFLMLPHIEDLLEEA